jgi:hypothetical protein
MGKNAQGGNQDQNKKGKKGAKGKNNNKEADKGDDILPIEEEKNEI